METPQKGATFIYRGKRLEIVDVAAEGMRIYAKNPETGRGVDLVGEPVWLPKHDAWTMPGISSPRRKGGPGVTTSSPTNDEEAA